VIVADTRTNSLLIQATRTQLDDLEGIIEQIDVPRDQVLVEAALIELAIDDLIRFGVEVTSASPDPEKTAAFGRSAFGLTTLSDTDADGIPDINVPNFSQAGLTAGLFDKDNFPVVLQALATTTNARALSMPSAVVEDGAQARMTVTDQVPFQIRSTAPGGETNFSVDFTDAEITLDISPHISSDNYLRLHIVQTVQSFRGQTSPDLPPPRTSREIETDIVVPDGYTVVMGGLITENTSDTVEGIPLLMDIPLLGHIFRSTRKSTTTTSLFLFVTPHILKNLATAGQEFADYHRVTWERKLLADRLLDKAVEIYHTRFKLGEDTEKEKDDLEKIQDSGYLDKPRYKTRPRAEMNAEEAWKRFRDLSKEKTKKGEDGK
jgi:general secretion pathway protein D